MKDNIKEIIKKIRYLADSIQSYSLDDLCDDLEQALSKQDEIMHKKYNEKFERWAVDSELLDLIDDNITTGKYVIHYYVTKPYLELSDTNDVIICEADNIRDLIRKAR